MFRREKAPAALQTLIGPTVTIRGDVDFTGGLHLEGRVCGNLRVVDGADSRLEMTASAVVEGEVHARQAAINGRVAGDVRITGSLLLGPKAVVDGNVYYGSIEMALGARITGKMVSRAPEPSAGPPVDQSLNSNSSNPSLQ